MRTGLTEADVQAALGDLDAAALPPATRAALRLADRLTEPAPAVDAAFYAELRQHFDEGQILALGAVLAVASGWQRFIEAFGIRPDGWTDGTPVPWRAAENRALSP
jgi:alkylhydroperoxidase family enzyme